MCAKCGADCASCGYGKTTGCAGCEATGGCPAGKPCFIANYIETGGKDAYEEFVKTLLSEINALGIPGLPEIKELFPLNGAYVNLEYPFGGRKVKLLEDEAIYLGAQAECIFSRGEADRCFGIVADMSMILVCEYGENGSNAEVILYKKR